MRGRTGHHRHLHGKIERAARCLNVKVPAVGRIGQSAVGETFLEISNHKRRRLVGDPTNLGYRVRVTLRFRRGLFHAPVPPRAINA